jgi:hypothetical protein
MNPLSNKMMRSTGLALLLIAVPQPARAQSSPDPDPGPVNSWSPTEALERMREIGAVAVPGEVPAHVSAGYEARGASLGTDFAAALDFYEATFGIRPAVELAVLDEADWRRVTPVPYGLPHPFQGTPNVVFLGATYEHEAVHDLRARRDDAPEADRERVRRAGLSWDEASGRLLDLVAFHELGHVYTHALGIDPHRRWFSEMLASYFAYAFLRSERPEMALVWDGVLAALPAGPPPAHTSLADFERLYVGVGIPNYQWYQAAFQARVAEVYEAQGLGFLERVREALPAGTGDDLTTDALLARLERLEPGFHAWAERLGLHSNE